MKKEKPQHHLHYNGHETHGQHVTWHDGISPEEDKIITEGLAAIYGDERDDLGKMDKAGSRVTRYLVRGVIALAIIAAVTYLAFFVYMRFFASPATDPFTMTIDVPADMVSGSAATVTLHYANTGNVPLASLAIDLNIPDAFTIAIMEPQPTNTDERIWNIGSIDRKEEGTIVLQGTWLTSVPSTKNIQALATYRPANFNADFDAVASTAVNTLTSNLAITGTGPEAGIPGEQMTYDFTVTNNGMAAFPAMVLALDLPEGFYIDETTPALEPAAAAEWELGVLEPAATSVVTVKGSFASTISDVQTLRASVLAVQDDVRLVQGEVSVFTDVEGNGLVVQLVGNGTADAVTMDPGDPLRLTIGYKNRGETALSGIALLVDFQADGKVPVTWTEASLDGGRLTQDGIRFDNLSLAVAEDKMKNLIFPVRDAVAEGEVQEWKVVVHATFGGVTIKSQPLDVSLNSDAEFTARARYYDESGAPLGEGPMPPVVGETTSYEIIWEIVNELHALSDMRVSTTLPPGVTWIDGETDYGAVAYDTVARTISWTTPAIGENAGTLQAILRVSVTPDADDVGLFIKLLSGSSFRATDTVTSSTIQRTTSSLTSECEGDASAEGKGVVVE